MNLKCIVVLFLYLLQDGYCRIYETEDAVIVEADDMPEEDEDYERSPRQFFPFLYANPYQQPTIPPVPTHPPGSQTHPPFITHPPAGGSGTTAKPPSTTDWTPTTNKPTSTETPEVTPSANYNCGKKNADPMEDTRKDLILEHRGDDGTIFRIVGGHLAGNGEWPWMAALFKKGRQFCGGSLVDNKHILTAAHCVYSFKGSDVANMRVRLKEYDLKDGRHMEMRVRRLVRHKGFNFKTLYDDVAILTLEKKVTFDRQLSPVCLASGSATYSGQTGTITGWGSLREGGSQPSKLMEVQVPILTNTVCKNKYGHAAPGGIVSSYICAGRSGYDSCSGDSGGPLMVVSGGTVTQVGIVSWGIGCGQGQYPGVYTRVTSFRSWIDKNLGKY